MASATNAENVELISNQIFFANMARVILLLLFTGITLLVYFAYRKRKNKI
jgi:positive regulator of sigma E activity